MSGRGQAAGGRGAGAGAAGGGGMRAHKFTLPLLDSAPLPLGDIRCGQEEWYGRGKRFSMKALCASHGHIEPSGASGCTRVGQVAV